MKKSVCIFLLMIFFSTASCEAAIMKRISEQEDNTVPDKNNDKAVQDKKLFDSLQEITNIEQKENGDVKSISIFPNDCSQITATPIIVGNNLVFSWHDKLQEDCTEESGYSFIVFNLENEKIYAAPLYGSESTSIFVEEKDLLFVPTLGSVGYFILDSNTFETNNKEENVFKAGVDSSALYLDENFYLGTVNTPFPLCQNPINKDCGSFYVLDDTGVLVQKLNVDNNFRAWVTGSPTTDGESIYVGTGEQIYGNSDETYFYGCSLLKLDADLNIIAASDPDTKGCIDVGNVESAIVGEPALGPDGIWIQFIGPTENGNNNIPVVHYDFDLHEICRAEFAGTSKWNSASYYQAPVIDKNGNAYVTYTLPSGHTGKKGVTARISPDCEVTEFEFESDFDVYDSTSISSPMLADDRYVLFATFGKLFIYTLDGEFYKEYSLGSNARVGGSPILYQGIIYVIQSDGTINLIEDSGLVDYGEAYWPRFRHDNAGRASKT